MIQKQNKKEREKYFQTCTNENGFIPEWNSIRCLQNGTQKFPYILCKQDNSWQNL